MASITFTNHDVTLHLAGKKITKQFLTSIFAAEHAPFRSIAYIFCSDEYLLSLNKQYLNHDTYTDILTFSLAETNMPITAEIYISTDRIKENATSHHVSFKKELLRVMIHGILHLCGYDDHTTTDKELMTKKEDHYLQECSTWNIDF